MQHRPAHRVSGAHPSVEPLGTLTIAELIDLAAHGAVDHYLVDRYGYGHYVVAVLNDVAGYKAGQHAICVSRDRNRYRYWVNAARLKARLEAISPGAPIKHLSAHNANQGGPLTASMD